MLRAVLDVTYSTWCYYTSHAVLDVTCSRWCYYTSHYVTIHHVQYIMLS